MSGKKRKESLKPSALGLAVGRSPEIEEGTDPVGTAGSSTLNKMIAFIRSNWWAVALIALFSLGAMGAGLKYLEEDAARVTANRNAATRLDPPKEGLLASVNPFLSAPTPTPTPQLSKEYIYAGSRLLAVEDVNANAAPPADLAIWRPSTGVWWVLGGTGSQQTAQGWGTNGDVPVPGDYDGDGKTDFCVFRPSAGTWYVLRSSDGAANYYYLGTTNDVVAQADYDGDGRTDAGVFRNGTWYIRRSSDSGITQVAFGLGSDTPAPADFDGDGKADIALYRSTEGKYYYLLSSQNSGSYQIISFGQSGDKPVPGDYDGDGKADAAVWRGDYTWRILHSSNGTTEGFTFGDPNSDKYVQNDYDGDGKVDRAFWRPSEGKWYIVNSSDNSNRIVQWGMNGDIPVPAFYRR